MGLPTKKHTRSSRGQRRAHHSLKKTQLGTCPQCQSTILPHHACQKCGAYGTISKEPNVIATKATKKSA